MRTPYGTTALAFALLASLGCAGGQSAATRPHHAEARAGTSVQQLAVDPRGNITGVILTDGTEYAARPGEDQVLRAQFRPGDPVRVEPEGPMAVVLRNERAGNTVSAYSPAALARGGGPRDTVTPGELSQLPRLVVRGRVNLVTRDANGAPTGFVMQNGVQVHTREVPAGVREGEHVRVDGRGTATANGTGLVPVVIERGPHPPG